MAARVFQAFFLNVIFCLVAAQSIKYGLKGQEVKLKPQIQEQQPDLILWMHDDNKVVEFNGKEEDVYDPFKHRTTLDWHSAELHLTDLRSEDSGLYELELYTQKKSYFYYYTLQVIDKVAKPTIICETNSSKSSNLSGLLTCSAPQPDIEYEWFFYGNTQPGPQLRIFLDNKHDERVYSCCVSNPLSNETAEFTAKDCYSVVLLLVLVVVAGVVIYRRCYKGRDNETEDESQLPLRFSPIKEGESQVQDEAPKQGGVRRRIEEFELRDAQQTPANSHRNHRGRDNKTAEDGECQLLLTFSPIKGRDNETVEDDESQLPLTSSPIKEGESQVQDEAPKQGGVRRLRDGFELRDAQQTPANSHRNHRDFSPQSQQKRPHQGQKGSDEDDEGDEGTGLVNKVFSDEPDPTEKEASDLESPTEQTASEKENKEQFIHSAGEDREVGSAQVIKEPDSSSTEADQSVDNSSGEADKSVDNSSGEADQSVDNSSGEADKSVDNSSTEADTSDIKINSTSSHTGGVS
uniref:Ig-like domain-containing protein n=1 Tax=Takifugu rubripes TaxID=31033 RepID=A0A674NX89_TAKRU